jgi:hypothetical protein
MNNFHEADSQKQSRQDNSIAWVYFSACRVRLLGTLNIYRCCQGRLRAETGNNKARRKLAPKPMQAWAAG